VAVSTSLAQVAGSGPTLCSVPSIRQSTWLGLAPWPLTTDSRRKPGGWLGRLRWVRSGLGTLQTQPKQLRGRQETTKYTK